MSELLDELLQDYRFDLLLGVSMLCVAVAGAAFGLFHPFLIAFQGVVAGGFLTLAAFAFLDEPPPTPAES